MPKIALETHRLNRRKFLYSASMAAAGASLWRNPSGASSASPIVSPVEKLNVVRSDIPAVTHVDYSARIQTVRRTDNPLYYDIIRAFYDLTGCPVIVNTSFNVKDEPIVCTPEDAYRCFMKTGMDVLVMESFVVKK